MKKIKNLLIAFLLVGALSIPTLALSGSNMGSVSGDAPTEEYLKEREKEEILGELEILLNKGEITEEFINNIDWSSTGINNLDPKVENPTTDVENVVEDIKKVSEQEGLELVPVAQFTATVPADVVSGQDDSITVNIKDVSPAVKTLTFVLEKANAPVASEGHTIKYHVVREHEYFDEAGQPQVQLERLDIKKYEEKDNQIVINFESSKFSQFILCAEEIKVEAPQEAPQQAPATQNNDKPVASYDDGGPFTTDACGNVFDRWGNEIYHAPVCVNESAPVTNNGYQFVNTLDK